MAVGFRERAVQERDADAGARPAVVVNGMFFRRALIASTAGAPIWSSSFKSAPPPMSKLEELAAVEHRDERVLVLLVEAPEARHEVADVEPVLAVAGK